MAQQKRFEAIGTTWIIDIYSEIAEDTFNQIFKKIVQRIATFDKHYSRFRLDSLIHEMASKAGTYMLPADAEPLIDTYKTLYTLTGGAFTPLIGQTLVDAGYDASYSLQPQKIKKPDPWEAVLDYEFPKLTIKKPALLDFGAGGKGCLVDIVSQILINAGVHSFCVDAGGDMYYHTNANIPITVGLEHPNDSRKIIGTTKLCNQSIAGSAGNRRAWSTFHHIIDPHTLASPKDITAVWVIAENTLIADALATALYFIKPHKLLETYSFEYVIMYSDHSVIYSHTFTGEIF